MNLSPLRIGVREGTAAKPLIGVFRTAAAGIAGRYRTAGSRRQTPTPIRMGLPKIPSDSYAGGSALGTGFFVVRKGHAAVPAVHDG
jgi:hypothetical protein